MVDAHDAYHLRRIINLVEDPIVSHSDTPHILDGGKLAAAVRPGVISKRTNDTVKSPEVLSRQGVRSFSAERSIKRLYTALALS